MALGDPSESQNQGEVAAFLLGVLKIIFSWVVLMPIAVIVSGKLLAQRLSLPTATKQLFRIPISGVLEINARNSEVILGFSGFLTTLFLLAITAGKQIYTLFKFQFGVDPGHFNSLCIFSSFATVVWSSLWFFLSRNSTSPLQSLREEHDKLIKEIAEKRKHDVHPDAKH